MEIVNIQKYIHTSPRKLRLVAGMVRKMRPAQAVLSLRFTNKAAAQPLIKAIETALANARQQKLTEEMVAFKSLEVNEAVRMRRMRAGSRGRGKPYKKRMSHIKVVLTSELPEQKVKASAVTVKEKE